MKKKLFWTAACVLLCALTACGKTDNAITLPESDAAPQTQIQTQPEPPEIPAVSDPGDIQPAEPSGSEEIKSEEPVIPQTGWSGMLMAYTDILEELYQAYQDPERFRYEDGPGFALYDVDLDGTEELIVQDQVGEAAGQWVRIYGYDHAAGTAYVELEEYPDLCYYDNGVIEAGWSHNQGAAGDKLWPYNVYQYNPETGKYEQIAAVDGWDRNLREIFAGENFPDEVDQDGDGFIYYIITEEGGYAPTYGEPMDYASYETWRESYLNGAFPTGPSFLPLVKENIAALGQ
ncbi:MAG: hypothetical protein HDT18_03425 [Oscillibacter sp.]|nr:hypothetical protein [Oscillibacter sp.]